MRNAIKLLAIFMIPVLSVSNSSMDTQAIGLKQRVECIANVSTPDTNKVLEKRAYRPPAPTYPYSEDEMNLLALVTMAEAEGESEYGKRLVIDTILNRVDDSYFPDTISGVVYESGQFSSMWNGRINKCYVRDDILQLVKEESLNRTNSEIVFFTAGSYGNYGTPVFSEGNHYFCIK